MGLSSKIFLDGRYTKRNGTQALKICITLDRNPIEFPTGYSIEPKYWNEKGMRIKSNCPSVTNVTQLNNKIRALQISLEDKLIGLQTSGEIKALSLKQIKDRLIGKDDKEQFVLSYCDQVITQIRTSGRLGNANVYKTMRNSLAVFLKNKDTSLKSITYKWIKTYEEWYLSKGNSINGLAVHMRTLRALLNRAIKERVLSRESYPFEQYRIRTEKTKKRAMTGHEFNEFKVFVPTSDAQRRAQDYFLMSFYMMGASFIDLAFLRLNNIKNGRIEYKRKKTGQLHSIKITQSLQAIIDRQTQGRIEDGGNPFILNVIRSGDPEKQYAQVKGALKRYNKCLREIGQLCSIQTPLSSYVSRHSYATIAKFKDVPISVISQALGHTNLGTTEIYLAQFGNDILDQYNEQIIEG